MRRWRIWKLIFPHALSVFTIFFTTLSIFPSTIARVRSMDQTSAWGSKFFTPVACFLLFNASDFSGRVVAGCWNKYLKSPRILCGLSFLRLALIPAFIYCNVQPRSSALPVVFAHDAWPIFFMFVFGSSNGYLASVGMMFAPERVPKRDCDLTGMIMSFCIIAGLSIGACASFLISPNI